MPRGVLALAVAVTSFLAACSGDDDDGVASTTTTPVETTTSSSAPDSDTSVTTAPSGAIVEVGDWRMVISAPGDGAGVASSLPLCYEITGSGRESLIALAASLRGDEGTVVLPQVDAAVGRGEATLDASAVPAGAYDLVVQLVVDGQPLEGLAVTISDVRVGGIRDDAHCA